MNSILAWGAPEFTLTRQQWVPRKMEEVFPFFEDPRNLQNITPDWLNFKIVSIEPSEIRAGTLIVYKLRWLGIPYTWRTLITEWIPDERFVDTQLNGPYILWHHTHTFKADENGVLLNDCVRYRLPFGPFGSLLHRILIRRQLEEIFDFRVLKISEMLSNGVTYQTAANNL